MTRRKVLIQRGISRDDGTPGKVTVDGSDWTADSLELSDRGNANDISCIPYGFYVVSWLNHPAHGWCWQLLGVKGRQAILIHPFNLAGNTESGYAKQALGCIGFGYGRAIFKAGTTFHVEGPHGPNVEQLSRDQWGITDSKKAVADFNAIMGTADFDLEIRAPAIAAADATITGGAV